MTILLQAEVDAVARFVELLKLERDTLSGGDINNLDSLVQRKNDVAAELQALTDRRNSLLAGMGFEPDRMGVEAWLAAHPANNAAQKSWSQVLSLAKEARELNLLNGELIKMSIQHNSKALETLRGATRQPNLYGPDGQSAPQNSRRIYDSV
jgi:flagellar biosynthesis protein FlgN